MPKKFAVFAGRKNIFVPRIFSATVLPSYYNQLIIYDFALKLFIFNLIKIYHA